MTKELNEWELVDPDCLQYCKKISDSVFNLVQFWEYPNGSGVVCGSTIDLSDYNDEQITDILSGYYDEDAVNNIRNKDYGNQIIAECIFESEGVIDAGWAMPVTSFEHADKLIEKYIEEA